MLRKNQTPEEDIIWKALRNHRFFGIKFYRQFSIGFYVADFYAPSHKLVIEIDGKQHETVEGKTYDEVRTETINSMNIRILRFGNHEIKLDLDRVMRTITDELGF